MCGILGSAQLHHPVDEVLFRKSLDLMNHRGPNNTGVEIFYEARIAIGHKRLAVLDLSSAGSQPMQDHNQQVVIAFNGEIYNYKELRLELEKYNFKFHSASDTEVLLYGYKQFGVEIFDKLRGMFAVAIYDKLNGKLVLGRDRAGEKPLFYSHVNNEFFFSSEIKSLLCFSGVSNIIDPLSVAQLFTFGHTNREHSIFKDIKKLPAGHHLIFDLNSRELCIQDYWNISSQLQHKKNFRNKTLTTDYFVDKLEFLLDKAVGNQLHADVPVGVLLSGGIDSSLISAFASRHKNNLDTYTVKFSNAQHARFDESPHARLIAKTFQTNHHELDASEIKPELINKLTYFFDEPIFHNSMIPTYLLSREISKTCTVAIGGDGGDELFGGYTHYNKLLKLKSISRIFPAALRLWSGDLADQYLPIGFKGKKTISFFASDFQRAYPNVAEFFSDSERRTIFTAPSIQEIQTDHSIAKDILCLDDYVQRATFFDFQNYLSEGILVKVDRASMANSLEIRAPFLDKDLIEFALLEVPSTLKANGSEQKILLKKLSERILPASFNLERKQGFSMPLGSLLQSGDWYEFFSATIASSDPQIFNQAVIYKILEDRGRIYQNSEKLFGLIFFMLWLKRFNPSF